MNAAVAVSLLVELLKQAATISTLVRNAQQNGRDLTAEELKACASTDDVARAALVDAIAKAKG